MKSIQATPLKYDQLLITTTVLPDSQQGKAYTTSDGLAVGIETTGGNGKNTFRISKGKLPKGLNLNEDGTITGMNEETEVSALFPVEITVTSGDGQISVKEF